jgi:CRISPR-associated endonuclease Csn1
MKKILGLDLGTNSIGWALISQNLETKKGFIDAIGSRIIPMSQEILGEFDKGNSVSQTATRTEYRATRRLRERHLLRRERLHRVLNLLNFLPEHFSNNLNKYGNFDINTEPKLAYKEVEKNKFDFIFKKAYGEMLEDFKTHQPHLLTNKNGEPANIPYDWTIYFLRKKALFQKITKEELAWLLLHFNQKRGYYQLRGEDEETKENKVEEFYNLKIVEVTAKEKGKKDGEIWYDVILENGWIYRRASKISLSDWKGKYRDFIVSTELNEDGGIKLDKDGKEKRSFRAPKDDDWGLLKKKTESDILKTKKTVGAFIYDSLLQAPNQKIKGKLVRTIERKFYKQELEQIIITQIKHHKELQDENLYNTCLEALYESNEDYRNSISKKDFKYLFIDNIIFYQRPLKSKKSEISNCTFESRKHKNKEGNWVVEPLKCISRSHPLFQEFRLWQWIQNLKIYEREKLIHGKLQNDVDVTSEFLNNEEDYVHLFDFLNDRKEVNQKALLGYFGKQVKILKYRWNFIDDEKKTYPCNETRTQITNRLAKAENIKSDFLTKEKEIEIWHILYSVTDKLEIEKALKTFASKNKIDEERFVENFKKYPLIKSEYGSYSEKAIKKLLPLMRIGKYWNEDEIMANMGLYQKNINDVITKINERENTTSNIKETLLTLDADINAFRGLRKEIATYVVYKLHSESLDNVKWKSTNDLKKYLAEFKQHSLRNPIVEQVITETLRVVNDIWNQYGEGKENFFDEIHIELGREMKNNAADRKSITENNTKNESTNIRIKTILAEFAKPEYGVENVRPYSNSQQEILKIYEDGVLNSGIEIDEEILKISKSNQPTSKEILKYKLWLEQKYRSPYTGMVIPLNKLFTTAYEIEHIIPQSIYFDDSFSNKVICESEVNKLKDNRFGYEFIANYGTTKVTLNGGGEVEIFTKVEYEDFIKQNFANNKSKMRKLLLEEVPEKMIERQLNDTRYISKIVKNILSNMVRADKDDDGVTSKNIISSNGNITGVLKQDWGLNDVWNDLITPRFERLNILTNSQNFGKWENKLGNKVFQTQVPLELQKGFNKKRIDHRHHAMDALIIACATRNHINYLNNQSALGKGKKKDERQKDRYDLKQILCFKTKPDANGNYKWQFTKPWETITQDTKNKLETTIISFKQNLRVINKTVNFYQKFKDGKKILVKQEKGENWAIRKAMHKDTVSGLVQIQKIKEVSLSNAIDDWGNITENKSLRDKIGKLLSEGNDKKKITKFFKDLDNKWNEIDITRVKVFYFETDLVASRVSLNDSFNKDKIDTITDTAIQKILLAHLENYNIDKDGKIIEQPELAFSPEGIEEMNKNINSLNNEKSHQPIIKVRTYEPKGNKYNVGHSGNKNEKFVEAAKGTNLYFAIYQDENGKRSYDTIGLNIVIERLKQGLPPCPEKENHIILFWLSPNDLVYIPSEEEIDNKVLLDIKNLTKEQVGRIYKMVSSTAGECHFVPSNYSSPILPNESGTNNKSERLMQLFKSNDLLEHDNKNVLKPLMIKNYCWKLEPDRLGNIKKIVK